MTTKWMPFSWIVRGQRTRSRERKIAIVGGGPTRTSAPFADPSWEIWAFSSKDWTYPRVTRWFELHAMEDLRSQLTAPKKGRRSFDDYMRYMAGLRCPVYMQAKHAEVPTSVPFPLREVLDAFGRCFTSTASYMVALAILEGARLIGLWGINPTSRSYAYQRSTLEYLLGCALKRGIEVYLPKKLPLKLAADAEFVHTPVLYAYDWRSPGAWWVKRGRQAGRRPQQARQKTGTGQEMREGLERDLNHWMKRRPKRGMSRGLQRSVGEGGGRGLKRGTKRVLKDRRSARRVLTVRDDATQRWIAIKENSNVEEAMEEFRAMQSCRNSKHLVRAERFFLHDGKGCIAMEWIPGHTLRETIRRRGALPPANAASIALGILAGLKELHRAGFVHGDLHADNVIVTDLEQGAVKIIDLQHAVPIGRGGRADAKRKLPAPPPALAPESKLGVIDVRYDLYGVGYMTAAMLLGKEPEEKLRRDALPRALAKKHGNTPGTLDTSPGESAFTWHHTFTWLGIARASAFGADLGIAVGSEFGKPTGAARAHRGSAARARPGSHDAETSAALRLWDVALKGAHPDPEERYPSADAMAEAVAAAVK